MTLPSLKLVKHWVKLVEAPTETKKNARKVRYAIPLSRGMGGALGEGDRKRRTVTLSPVLCLYSHDVAVS